LWAEKGRLGKPLKEQENIDIEEVLTYAFDDPPEK
jgi:hypothetical protein